MQMLECNNFTLFTFRCYERYIRVYCKNSDENDIINVKTCFKQWRSDTDYVNSAENTHTQVGHKVGIILM